MKIGQRLKLSDDVAGATLMAAGERGGVTRFDSIVFVWSDPIAGTSFPEFSSSFISLYNPATGSVLGMATVCGSSVYNILVIIGCSAIAGGELWLDWKPLIRDSTFYFITVRALITRSIGIRSSLDTRPDFFFVGDFFWRVHRPRPSRVGARSLRPLRRTDVAQ